MTLDPFEAEARKLLRAHYDPAVRKTPSGARYEPVVVPTVEKPVCNHAGKLAPWLATVADTKNGLRDLRCPICRMILDAPLKGDKE